MFEPDSHLVQLEGLPLLPHAFNRCVVTISPADGCTFDNVPKALAKVYDS
jgi:hypothetical protein